MTVSETIDSLKFGDLIEIGWLDASESTGRLKRAHARFGTPVRSVGYFLGLKDRRTKHVMIAKKIISNAKAYHYNVIPTGMIENITVLAKDRLDPETKRVPIMMMTMSKLKFVIPVILFTNGVDTISRLTRLIANEDEDQVSRIRIGVVGALPGTDECLGTTLKCNS